jgi:hypothetical protein
MVPTGVDLGGMRTVSVIAEQQVTVHTQDTKEALREVVTDSPLVEVRTNLLSMFVAAAVDVIKGHEFNLVCSATYATRRIIGGTDYNEWASSQEKKTAIRWRQCF